MSAVQQLGPLQAREWLNGGRGQLLDVREHWEYELVHLPGATLIPLGELPQRWTELNRALPVLVYCHHGLRSWHAACMLQMQGFGDLANLAGGIDAWARLLEPHMPRY